LLIGLSINQGHVNLIVEYFLNHTCVFPKESSYTIASAVNLDFNKLNVT